MLALPGFQRTIARWTSRKALGPIWDHTFCAVLNDLHVHARSAGRG